MAEAGADERGRARAAHRHGGTLRAGSGWPPRRLRATWRLTRRRNGSAWNRNRRWCSPMKPVRCSWPASSKSPRRRFARGAENQPKRFVPAAASGWHEHHRCLFCGTERFFRTSYQHNLVGAWLPALDGSVEAKLRRGAARRGRGLRARRIDHPDGTGLPEIALLRLRLSSAVGRTGARKPPPRPRASPTASRSRSRARRTFRRARANLVAFFECLHDMGDAGRRGEPTCTAP